MDEYIDTIISIYIYYIWKRICIADAYYCTTITSFKMF